MKRHLRYRLMAMMLVFVLVITVFVGITLFSNIVIDYHRDFYEDMEEVESQITFFEVTEGKIHMFPSFLRNQESLDPLTTDRVYYLLQGETVLDSTAMDGVVRHTGNLRNVMAGGEQKEAGLFAATLDYALALELPGYYLYVVDQRSEMRAELQNYALLFSQALLIGALLAVALSFLFARQFLIPIQRLTESARKMQQLGEFTEIQSRAKDEVGELTRVFNQMGTRISRNYQMLLDLLRNIPKPLFAVNDQGIIVHSNAAFKNLFDAPPLKSQFLEGHEEDARFILCINDRYFCVYRSLFLLENGADGTLFLLDDITEAETLERERRQFVADVSHELKTPLTVIKSYSETMLESELDPATAQRFLKVIERSADQMNAMVSQLLELSKTESAPSAPKEPLELVTAAREVAEAMTLELQKKELRLVMEMPEQRELHCEPDKIRRVMINLLSNSVKYSNPGGTVTLSLRETEGGVLFAVADEGIGIAREHLPHLFDKFYRVDKARSRQTGGTGLGLSIVHSIVTGMGGRVEVESTPGEGSIFTCYFPD